MNVIRVLLELLGLYLLYRIIFDFIVPIYQTTRQVKRKVDEMQQKVNSFHTSPKTDEPKKASRDDYIDYEEVK